MNSQEKALQVYQQLLNAYGAPIWQPGDDPIGELVLTILSANTNDVNSGRAFAQLQAVFGNDWAAVCQAPLTQIKELIRPAGMYNQKAPNLVAALTQIKEDVGSYSLDHLADLPVAEALAYLMTLPGVGHKTASIVLLFCFNRGSFPVDTHVQRISQRLGISERRATPEKIKARWESLLPPNTYYALHITLIDHGRHCCQARDPHCALCPLHALCDYANGQGEWRLAEAVIG
jgi:endonuclease III